MKKNGMGKGGKCFIATAAYGSEFSKEVVSLKLFRDEVLSNTRIGRVLIKAYYRLSPSIARMIENQPNARTFVRFLLKPIVLMTRRKNEKC